MTNDNESDALEVTNTSAPAVLCGGCYINKGADSGGSDSSYRVPEGLAPGIVPSYTVTKYIFSGVCDGEPTPYNGILALARNKAEAKSFLECGAGEFTVEIATQEGSACSLWRCGD